MRKEYLEERGCSSVTFAVPIKLYKVFSKLCIDEGISRSEAFLRYLRYLSKEHSRKRTLLNEQSPTSFRLDSGQFASLRE